MATLIIDSKPYTIPNGGKIRSACEQAGVIFNCNTGICGECEIEICEGAENLNPVQKEEGDMGLAKNRRLACLCIITRGTVKIKTL